MRLILQINGTPYVIRRLDPHPAVAYIAWRVMKIVDGSVSSRYDVHQDDHGFHCTCPDFIHCRDGKDAKGCRHVAGLRAAGLFQGELT